MIDTKAPIVIVICNDYGELALAMYLLESQSFAQNATLMLPPRLHKKNADVLPGRTFVYNSIDDIQKKLDSQSPGILGLFSGYLLPVHRLCDVDELDSLMSSSQERGWEVFTSDPFLGLLEDVDPSELVTFKLPKWSTILSVLSVAKKMRRAAEEHVAQSIHALTEMRRLLDGILHVYPCGKLPPEAVLKVNTRMHFHNPAFVMEPVNELPEPVPEEDSKSKRWLFLLGDQDYEVQEEKYGQTIWIEGAISRKFRSVLLDKMHETLETGRIPTLIAPAKVIASIRKHSRAADSMELLAHCDYAHFQSLLVDAEYVFYWNAVSFSCIPRSLTGKPWFTFDDGHLLRGMNAEYNGRISEWFYKNDDPPRLDIKTTLTSESLHEAKKRSLKSAWKLRDGLMASSDPQALFPALEALAEKRATEAAAKALVDAFEITQQLGGIVSANKLDGSVVVDTQLLTHSKGVIRDAVSLLIEKGNDEQAAFARSAVLTLAFFQQGAGDGRHAIDSPGPDGRLWKEAVQAEMVEITRAIPG